VLARAHARSAEPWTIAGYLGRKDTFDEAMGDFAVAYADQTERDHARLKSAAVVETSKFWRNRPILASSSPENAKEVPHNASQLNCPENVGGSRISGGQPSH